MKMMTEPRAFDLLTMGEIMLRLSPPNNERITRGDVLEKRAGGSELNVASGVSLLGLRSGIITKLPDNPVGMFIRNWVRYCDVSDDYIVFDRDPDARLGIYYYENGAHPRKPRVVYDRKNSSMTRFSPDEIPDTVYASTRMFHTSGITLALSESNRRAAIEMIRRFKQAGAQISLDVNYRANLWSESDAYATLQTVLPMVDVLFVSEETSRRMFRKTGTRDAIMRSYCTEYGVSVVAATDRVVINPHKHDFGSTIYDAESDRFFTEPPYRGIEVVDRIGSGDAYVSGVLFGLLRYGDLQQALEFGDAASSLKDTIPGDLPSSDFAEVQRVIRDHQSTGPQSELVR